MKDNTSEFSYNIFEQRYLEQLIFVQSLPNLLGMLFTVIPREACLKILI